MGKWTKRFMAGMVTVCALTSQVSFVSAEENLVEMVPSEEGEQVLSYLTGEPVAESAGRRRPVAVMMGNNAQGAPQSGIASAGVVYEAPVEGNMTRLMGIIEEYDSLLRIGSVRSCRDYYVFYANEFDAVYSHFGQAVYALPYLENIDNLNGLALEGSVYFRTSDRKAPHNAYTDGEKLKQGIRSMGYRETYKEDYDGHYLFASDGEEVLLENGISATLVKLDNFTDNHPVFSYDPETKEYKRSQYGEPHIDLETKEQLSCDNIILQYSDYRPYDANGYLNIDTASGGAGRYITRGRAIDITWQKDSPWGETHYYDTNGQEIRLNTGKTWVEIVLNDKKDAIIIQ